MAPQANSNDNLSAVLYGAKDFRLEQRPIPNPKDDELLVRVHTVGLCGTDLHFWGHGAFGSRLVQEPVVIGHEVSGTVEKVGKKVTGFAVGDRVVWKRQSMQRPAAIWCICSLVAQPAEFCIKLPDNVSMEEGAMLEPLCCAVHSCNRADIHSGQTVLICGSGAIGVLSIICAKAMGAVKIIATDLSDKRLAIAKDVGADHVLNVSGKTPKEAAAAIVEILGYEPEVTLECTGFGPSIETAIWATKPGGKISVAGMGANRADIPIWEAITKEIDILPSLKYVHSTEFSLIVDMVASERST
uniref:Sorbitol dehydrogenase n=1 Tax=Ditylenchus dipsaci TaxID=166011 RepID=A0A915EDM0_9BILA